MPRARVRPSGMTLIEMLVATAVTLVMMAAIGQVFSTFGRGVSGSRTALEMQARMRTAAWRLRQDLQGATAPMIPPLDPSDGLGYLEIIEGPRHDADAQGGDLAADYDDVLLLTSRSAAAPFRGAFEGRTIESDVAEVAWFARPTVPATVPPTYTLYRKQMLVVGYAGVGSFFATGGNRIQWSTFTAPEWRVVYDTYDVSVSRRVAGANDYLVPNTLGDLTKREHRFMHNPLGDTSRLPVPGGFFPYTFANSNHQVASLLSSAELLPSGLEGLVFDSNSPRFGEDVVLTNVVAFDVRVFDPAAPIANSSSGKDVVTPENSPPAPTFPAGPYQANGAYVDLGNGLSTSGPSGVLPRFFGNGSPLSRLVGSPCVYDTWSTHYEADGVDQDGSASGVDQGTNGVDDAIPIRPGLSPPVMADGVIDDSGETETQAPYPHPLRGVEIRIRCYEPSSRQVRQVTVRHTFVPH